MIDVNDISNYTKLVLTAEDDVVFLAPTPLELSEGVEYTFKLVAPAFPDGVLSTNITYYADRDHSIVCWEFSTKQDAVYVNYNMISGANSIYHTGDDPFIALYPVSIYAIADTPTIPTSVEYGSLDATAIFNYVKNPEGALTLTLPSGDTLECSSYAKAEDWARVAWIDGEKVYSFDSSSGWATASRVNPSDNLIYNGEIEIMYGVDGGDEPSNDPVDPVGK